MVVGFECAAKQHVQFEEQLITQFINSLKKRVGKDKLVTVGEIEMSYRNRGQKIDETTIKAVIHHIRCFESISSQKKRYFIMSNEKGYWVTSDKREITLFATELEQRANKLLNIKTLAENFLLGKAAVRFLNEGQEGIFNG